MGDLWDDISFVGEADNGIEAVNQCRTVRPDVVLMDIGMPKMDGVIATRIIRERLPETRVIALAGFLDADRANDAFEAGACCFMLKNVDIHILQAAIRGTHSQR